MNIMARIYGRKLSIMLQRKLFLLSPLSVFFIMKHKTGKKHIYRNTMDSIKKLYNKQEVSIIYKDYPKINQRKTQTYTSYRLPVRLDNGKVLAVKSGINQRDYFVVIDSTGNESKILTTGTISGLKTDVHHNMVLWDEIASDPRWALRNYSEIRIFDLSKNKLQNLTKKSRYFSPDFSPDGSTIAVSETDLQNTHYLTLLSAKNGKAIRQFPSPDNREVTFLNGLLIIPLL